MMVTPLFDTSRAEILAASEDAMSDHRFSLDGRHAFATVSKNGERAIAEFDLGRRNPNRNLIVGFHDPDELLSHPGELMTSRTGNGIDHVTVSSNGRHVYLRCPRCAPARHRPAQADLSTPS